jgi:hypothetical protein
MSIVDVAAVPPRLKGGDASCWVRKGLRVLQSQILNTHQDGLNETQMRNKELHEHG